MTKKTLKCGIMPKDDYIKRTIAIAKGEYKPSKNEPTVWFESPQAMGQILNQDNIKLLKIIVTKKPKSIQDLANISGRAKSNLSRTLKTMSRHGIVTLKRKNRAIVPIAIATDFRCDFGISSYYPFLFQENNKQFASCRP